MQKHRTDCFGSRNALARIGWRDGQTAATLPVPGGNMTRLLLALLLLTPLGCASNKNAETAGARIHDTATTAQDSTNPNDTLPRIRDSVNDSM
jgi:hypothetical protein